MTKEEFKENYTAKFNKKQNQVIIVSKSDPQKGLTINLHYNEQQLEDLKLMTPYEMNKDDFIREALKMALIVLDNESDDTDIEQ
jgi:hypothetical protein